VEKIFLACKFLGAALFILICLAFWPTPTTAAVLIALLALLLVGGIFYLEQRVKADLAVCASRNHFFRVFRHELMNHLQIISCLSQLGKQERLYHALNGLNEKLKIFGEISGLSSPGLMQALGEFIISLPGETPVILHRETPFQAGDGLAAEPAQFLHSLTACLRESRPKHVSLSISPIGRGRFLKIAAVANREVLQACLENEKVPWPAFIQWQEETRQEGGQLFVCTIPLKMR
jgi:hypothetical protein